MSRLRQARSRRELPTRAGTRADVSGPAWTSRRGRGSESPCEEGADGQPDAAGGVVDPLETCAWQDGCGAELRLIPQADLGANRDRIGEIAADAGIGPEEEQRRILEVVEVVERQPDFEHPDRGPYAVLESDAGHSGNVRSEEHTSELQS